MIQALALSLSHARIAAQSENGENDKRFSKQKRESSSNQIAPEGDKGIYTHSLRPNRDMIWLSYARHWIRDIKSNIFNLTNKGYTRCGASLTCNLHLMLEDTSSGHQRYSWKQGMSPTQNKLSASNLYKHLRCPNGTMKTSCKHANIQEASCSNMLRACNRV